MANMGSSAVFTTKIHPDHETKQKNMLVDFVDNVTFIHWMCSIGRLGTRTREVGYMLYAHGYESHKGNIN